MFARTFSMPSLIKTYFVYTKLVCTKLVMLVIGAHLTSSICLFNTAPRASVALMVIPNLTLSLFELSRFV